MAKIAILGDFVPLGSSETYFKEKNASWFTEKLGPIFKEADYRFLNLECPIINLNSPIKKMGPTLGIKAKSADALKNFSLIGLANNHILDHGALGLDHTIKMLKKSDIAFLGAGANLNEAGKPHVAEIGNVRVGFLAWTHREFCVATSSSPGAFPIDICLGLQHIENLRRTCDFIILFYHGGIENFPYPSPEQRKICQFLATRGINLIVCQHSHTIGASERCGNCTILYGQGNYSFDLPGKNSVAHWYVGLMLEVTVLRGRSLELAMIPIIQNHFEEMRPMVADPCVSSFYLSQQKKYSDELSSPEVYNKIWTDYASHQARNFLYGSLPVGRVLRKILKIFKIVEKIYGTRLAIRMLNSIECEAHRDVISDGLKAIVSENPTR